MDIHFHGYKIKYDMLDKYFRVIQSGVPIHSINIFINLDDFFHKLHSPLINNEFQIIGQKGPKQMVSNILNLMGHYRNYAKKKLKCETVNVYGIYTTYLRSFKNEMYLPDYRKKYKNENNILSEDHYYINQILMESYSMMRGISQYIPGVYLVDSMYIEPSVIPYYISNIRKCNWNLLITRDIYDLQYTIMKQWTVISPKGENSTIISGGNIWEYIAKKERIKLEENKYYPVVMLPYLVSISGDKYRSIPRLRKLGWKTLFNFMDRVIEECGTTNEMSIKYELENLLRDKKKITDDEFNSNMACVDVVRQYATLLNMDRIMIDSQLIDRYDYNALLSANHQIFVQNPLRLEFLI